ncbi:MAG: MASE1 domain-containing protein, partial [Candidatus Tectimicrobiota bacterium]
MNEGWNPTTPQDHAQRHAAAWETGGSPPPAHFTRQWVALGGQRPLWLHLVLCYVVSTLAGGFGQGLALIPGVAITFWPPVGILLGTLLLHPRGSWPWWMLAGGLAELTCNAVWFHNPLPFALLYYAGNALEALTAAWLITRGNRRTFRLTALEEATSLVVLGAGIAPMVSATVIALTDAWLGRHPFTTAWPLVWLGDGTGILVSTPLTLVAVQTWRERARIPPLRLLEPIVLGLILLGLNTLACRGDVPTVYMTLPPLLWVAVRFQLQGAATALGLLTLMTAICTATGQGEFTGPPDLLHARIVMLQTFLGIAAISALIVATLSLQRDQALRTLSTVNAALEARVAERTATLRESEARLRGFYDTAPFFMGVTEPGNDDVLHLYDNPATCRFFGTEPGATAGKWARAELGAEPATVQCWIEHYRHSEATGEPVHFEHAYTTPEGTRWLAITVCPIGQSASGRTRFCYVGEDITARKRAEVHLAFLTALSTAITPLESPAEIAALATEMVCRHFGTTRAHFTDFHVTTASSHGASGPAPDLPDEEARHRLALAGNTAVLDLLQAGRLIAVDNVDTDTRLGPLRAYYRAGEVGSVVLSPHLVDGAWASLLSMYKSVPYAWQPDELALIAEITGRVFGRLDRARALEALRAGEERLRLALDGAELGSWDVDLRTGVTVWNQRHTTLQGYAPDDGAASLERWRAHIHAEDQERVMAAIEYARRERGLFAVEHRFQRADTGELRWLALYGRFAYDDAGTAVRFSGVSRDITEHKRAEAALRDLNATLEQRVQERTAALAEAMATQQRLEREAQRAEHFALLGRLAAGVSHELRNPLAVVFLNVDLLTEELQDLAPDDPPGASEALAEIRTNLARVEDLVEDYLSLVRVGALERTVQDLGVALLDWAAEFQAGASAQGSILQTEGLGE